jgi:hypothetical protein
MLSHHSCWRVGKKKGPFSAAEVKEKGLVKV